ncbi:Nuclear transcription factor Y subunit gamma [Trichinella pseudospiralis]|uniref:Nuclear transcription factor Y subunit gamma n=1 Tax=Trichinella pseudospiralis TaxID=6337 RepID=A0A0V1KAE6_TRIPS|nr:Nuclear transcription factor Y subunit gamma [Trichinella pseudospiralis]KRZ44202.1 Nuclear transcription factor Y subunit gamma [Trichinella pseudospiralis]KRZ44203.1 Nuclear transcription factor Y subunit gamma [Trichinella pseudospiralis]
MDFSQSDTKQKLEEFWKLQLENISKMDAASVRNPRLLDLPIARVKKIMKLDEEVKPLMISAEAPVLLAKAAQMFIENLTLRAWGHTEENKRKTLQKNDIAMAISKDDQFDFLIDTVPREHAPKAPASSVSGQCGPIIVGTGGNLEAPVESLQYFIQLGSVPLQEGSGAQQLNESQLLQLPNGQVYSAITVPPHLITGNTPMQILSPMNCNNEQEQPMLQQFLAVDSSTGQLQAIQVDQNQMEAGNSNNSVVGSSLPQLNTMPTTLILQSSDGQPYHELQITNLEQTVCLSWTMVSDNGHQHGPTSVAPQEKARVGAPAVNIQHLICPVMWPRLSLNDRLDLHSQGGR